MVSTFQCDASDGRPARLLSHESSHVIRLRAQTNPLRRARSGLVVVRTAAWTSRRSSTSTGGRCSTARRWSTRRGRPTSPDRRPAPAGPCATCSPTWRSSTVASPPRPGGGGMELDALATEPRCRRPDRRLPRVRRSRPRCLCGPRRPGTAVRPAGVHDRGDVPGRAGHRVPSRRLRRAQLGRGARPSASTTGPTTKSRRRGWRWPWPCPTGPNGCGRAQPSARARTSAPAFRSSTASSPISAGRRTGLPPGPDR